jgi:transcriptional regulator with XRE-family HTH domain
MHFVIKKEDQIDKIGTMLNNIRVEQSITQEELARKMKVAQSYISQTESNRKKPTLPTLIKYLKACGYEIVFQKKSA